MLFKKRREKKENKRRIKKALSSEKGFREYVEESEEKMREFGETANANLDGIDLEKEGRIEEAKAIYESLIASNFDGNHPYDRLAILYRKEKDYDNEIRVLNHGIKVFKKLSRTSPRGDIRPKLKKFKTRLARAEELKKKNENH